MECGDEASRPTEKVGDTIGAGKIVSQGKCYDGKGVFLCWFIGVTP